MRIHGTEESALSLQDISFAYGVTQVLDRANLSVKPGQIVGLLGANGAGKSTLVHIATGLLEADRGSVQIAGFELSGASKCAGGSGKRVRDASKWPRHDQLLSARRLLGCAPQDTGVYPALTVRENLRGFAGLYGLRRKQARQRSDEVIAALGLDSCADTLAERLSGGQRRRLHTGIALVHEPEVLILDEATVGSDVQSRQQIVALVRSLAHAGTAILYTTHYLNELEAMRADISVLQSGQIRHCGSVDEVVARWGANEVALRVEANDRDPARQLLGKEARWQLRGDWLVCTAASADPTQLLAEALTELGRAQIVVCEVDIRRASLENAYLHLVAERESERNDVAA